MSEASSSFFKTAITILLSLVILLNPQEVFCQSTKSAQQPHYSVFIPADGNSWVISDPMKSRQMIRDSFIKNWTSAEDTVNIYFHTSEKGKFSLGIAGRSTGGTSTIKVSHEGRSAIAVLSSLQADTIKVGKFEVKNPGYQCIRVTGIRKSSDSFGEISGLLLEGEIPEKSFSFVRDDVYWGKRGPSVHLSYAIPETAGDVLWFYNEINVPEGDDVLGSYFMANGFAQGYFGMQVNSETERRFLFSVWSPFATDDPSEIPEEKRIVMLKKGKDVHTGEFGNEGSGGQSYLRFPWKAGTTYGFLLKGEPQGDNSTNFTAWFYAPENGEWQLIASFRRPETDTYLLRLHSFLENFYTETGVIARRASYMNQWICNSEGEWYEMTRARFTADATARKGARLDYSGGTEDDHFFLQNCGFTNDHTEIDTYFKRGPGTGRPKIDFSALPN